MKNLALLLCCLCLTATSFAQLPDHTQLFEPVPPQISGVSHETAPSDAIVLFDGSNMNAWQRVADGSAAQWDIEDGAVTVNGTGTLRSKQSFDDFQLHLEWRASDVIRGESQSRGNSGIFLHSLYEVQILDGWENPTYVNGQAGAVYLQHVPEVDVSRRPGEWQSYDIIFTAPVYGRGGALESPAYVTVLHNGVLVQNHVEILGSTFTRAPEYNSRCTPYAHDEVQACDGKMPLLLQDHGQVVSFRNIWIRER